MKILEQMRQPITQAEFAMLIGVSEAKVSQLLSEGVIERGVCAHDWLTSYCQRMRDQAAGRIGSEIGGLDLVQERAALAREQRLGIEIKNAVLRKEYAPIILLAEVLAMASQAIVERFEQLPGMLKRTCPDLPEAARDQVMSTLAAARNEWVARTAALVGERLVDADDDTDPIDV